VHECLGQLPAFQEAYQRNRRLQLNSDLAPPAQFLDGYQAFIAQLTGFFVIEDRVQRRCPALSGGAQVCSALPAACYIICRHMTVLLPKAQFFPSRMRHLLERLMCYRHCWDRCPHMNFPLE
jgi:hypothetical protein